MERQFSKDLMPLPLSEKLKALATLAVLIGGCAYEAWGWYHP